MSTNKLSQTTKVNGEVRGRTIGPGNEAIAIEVTVNPAKHYGLIALDICTQATGYRNKSSQGRTW